MVQDDYDGPGVFKAVFWCGCFWVVLLVGGWVVYRWANGGGW